MDLRQLQHLLAVAEHHSFSAAARALHTVQSNVSTHVARLERELQVVLVDRRTMELTPEGEAVTTRSRRILAELQAIVDDVVALRDEVRGAARVGVIGTTGRWLVPELLRSTSTNLPQVSLVIVDATTTSLVPQVVSGTLDLAIVNTPVDNPDVEMEILFDEERIVVAPLGHPLAEHDEISIPELASHAILVTPPGTVFRNAVDADAAEHGVAIRPLAEVDGMRLMATLAFQGFGPALLPASALPGYTVGGNWKRVRVPDLSRRSVGAIRSRRTTLSAPARSVLQTLREVVLTEGPRQPGIHVRTARSAT
jgi:DNA-binding transcriptional LysR family regulator